MRNLHLIVTVAAALCFISCESVEQSEIDNLKRQMSAITNQLMMQHFLQEEGVRSQGKSGLKVVRLRYMGTKSYMSDSYTSFGVASIHEHADHIRTIGMGEFSAVLNGIDFRTRHNDYRMYMPSRTNQTDGALEEVPFPEVPASVLKENNVEKAMDEMKEYFRAWRDANTTHRDYKPYFRPVLCYLEGAWTNTGEKIDEPFVSDRHFIDATTWMEFQKKARYVAYSGSKSIQENLATLPTAIINMVNDTVPEFAQFNYNIKCHPLSKYVEPNRFRVVDDLHQRLNFKRQMFTHERSRSARFSVGPEDKPYYDGKYSYGLLDQMMNEIPGRNNYPCELYDDGLETAALNMDGKTKMNVCRYHRMYKIGGADATGLSVVHRGYNDEYLFSAMTTQPKVAGMDLLHKTKLGRGKIQTKIINQKWTWAIPLEVIYLTPLHKWNPYNIEYKGLFNTDSGEAAEADGRNGDCKKAGKELNGVNSKNYYITPIEFFEASHSRVAADTAKSTQCVLDRRGQRRTVHASGVHVFLPVIKGVGALRTRYPIFPIHSEGSSIWKEVDSIKQLLMDKENYAKYYWNHRGVENFNQTVYYETSQARTKDDKRIFHKHSVVVTPQMMKSMRLGEEIKVQSSEAAGHRHEITLMYDTETGSVNGIYCDGTMWRCPDGHRCRPLTKIETKDEV